jgi:uncharacterized protein YyaL (SSP411 family)
MLVMGLLRPTSNPGGDEVAEKALGVFKLTLGGLQNAGSSFGWGLVGVDLYLSPRREIAIVGPPSSDVARKALRRWDPRAVIVFGPADDVPLLEGKTLVDGMPAVYVWSGSPARRPSPTRDLTRSVAEWVRSLLPGHDERKAP